MAYSITIFEKGGQEQEWQFDKEEVSIGRVQGNDIILAKGNISKRHARIVHKDGKFILVDLRSTNGTYVNGRKIASPIVVTQQDKIYVGDFILSVHDGATKFADESAPPPAPEETEGPLVASDDLIESPAAPVELSPPAVPAHLGLPAAPIAPASPPSKPTPMATVREAVGAPDPRSEPVVLAEPTPSTGSEMPPELDALVDVDDLSGAPGETLEPQYDEPDLATPAPPAAMIVDPEATSALSGDVVAKIDAMVASRAAQVDAEATAALSLDDLDDVPDAGMDTEDTPVPPGMPALVFEEPSAPKIPELEPVAAMLPPEAPEPLAEEPEPEPVPAPQQVEPPVAPHDDVPAVSLGAEQKQRYIALLHQVHGAIASEIDLADPELTDDDLWTKAENATYEQVEVLNGQGQIPSFVDANGLIQDILNELLGYGPIEAFLSDPTVSEVYVNRSNQLYVQREGAIVATDKVFSSQQSYRSILNRMLASTGSLSLDELGAFATVRLHDGATLEIVRQTIAPQGPVLVYRKPAFAQFTLPQLVDAELLSDGMAEFLQLALSAGKSVVLSGLPGSGRTTLLNALVDHIPAAARTVVIEDVSELTLGHPNVVSLQVGARAAATTQSGADVIHHALRLRPKVIVIGDIASDMVFPLFDGAGFAGVSAVLCASGTSPEDTLNRLERSARLAHSAAVDAIREQLSSAIEVVVHLEKFPCGTRKVTHLCVVSGMQHDLYALKDVFQFKSYGPDENGTIQGRLIASGYVPEFVKALKQAGRDIDMGIFK